MLGSGVCYTLSLYTDPQRANYTAVSEVMYCGGCGLVVPSVCLSYTLSPVEGHGINASCLGTVASKLEQ